MKGNSINICGNIYLYYYKKIIILLNLYLDSYFYKVNFLNLDSRFLFFIFF